MRRSLVLLVLLVGCHRDGVSARAAKLAADCEIAAETYYAMRALAGAYPRAQQDERTLATQDGMKKCAEGSPRPSCCEEAKKLRDRVDGKGKVALCDDFFGALAAEGCADLR